MVEWREMTCEYEFCIVMFMDHGGLYKNGNEPLGSEHGKHMFWMA
jgi:hypothetical protein